MTRTLLPTILVATALFCQLVVMGGEPDTEAVVVTEFASGSDSAEIVFTGPGTDAEGLGTIEEQKLNAYLAWCRANGGDVVRVPDAGELLRLASQERARDRLLGVLAHESGTGVKMMNSALDVGMRPGRDFLLIAFDNGNRGERTNIRMSAVKTFSLRMGQRAVEVLATLASGNRTVTETLPPELIRRETCGQPSHSAR